MLLRILPEQIVTDDATGTTNHGGRIITAAESPTGEQLSPGDIFECPPEWYAKRKHWFFLEVVEEDEPAKKPAAKKVAKKKKPAKKPAAKKVDETP